MTKLTDEDIKKMIKVLNKAEVPKVGRMYYDPRLGFVVDEAMMSMTRARYEYLMKRLEKINNE